MSRQLPLTPKERARRRKVIETVGTYLYGESFWKAGLAAALKKTTDRTISRVALAGYAAEGEANRPVPDWVMDALQETVAVEATRIRAEAEKSYTEAVSGANAAEQYVNDAETELLLNEVLGTIMDHLNEAESDS